MSDEFSKEMKDLMLYLAKPYFTESEITHLKTIVRITGEFHSYLEHGSTNMAQRLTKSPQARLIEGLENAKDDPFNRHDLEFMCETIISGIDSFFEVNASYRISDGAIATALQWDVIGSRDALKAQFNAMFDQFREEENFETKCRLLLDLFKLQIIFVGVLY